MIRDQRRTEETKKILTLLLETGAIAASTVHKILGLTCSYKTISRKMKRLEECGLVYVRNDGCYGDPTKYYQLVQRKWGRQKVAEYLFMQPDDIRLPQFHKLSPHYTNLLAIWIDNFKKMFPGCQVLRNYESARNPEIIEMLGKQLPDVKNYPSLLLIVPSKTSGKNIQVAVEFDFYAKEEMGYLKKHYRYAYRADIDGVLLINSKYTNEEHMELIRRSSKLSTASRIKHFGQNFWACVDMESYYVEKMAVTRTLRHDVFRLQDWVVHLDELKIAHSPQISFPGRTVENDRVSKLKQTLSSAAQ